MKKLSILFTLALATVCTTGCDVSDIFGGGGDKDGDTHEKVNVESISLSEEEIKIDVNDTYQINPTVLPEGANQNVTYSSVNEEVAFVDDLGLVTGIANGVTLIKITSAENEEVAANLTVKVGTQIDPQESFVISFDANGGTGTMENDVSTGSYYILPDCSFERTDYTFICWARGSVDGEKYQADETVGNITEDTTFYAIWQRDGDDPQQYFTVSFNSNGGSNSPANKSVEENGTFTFPSPGTKIHYTFLGWSSDGGETKYAAGSTSLEVTANIAYTAYWQEDAKCTVTYTAGTNGTGSYLHTNQYVGSYTLLPFNNLNGISALEGYVFKNYTYSGASKNPGDSITINGATTLTVNFEEEPTPPDPGDYYAGIYDSDKGESLKTKLHNKIKITDPCWDYGELYDCYRHSDVREDGEHFWDIYSDTTMYTLYDSRISANYKKEGDSMNREHMIPQSVFYEKTPMVSDPHHVLPSDGKVNGMRGNYPHGIVTGSPDYTSNDGCKRGSGTGGTTVFEPMNHYKGDIARIYFYFVTCYQNKLSSFKAGFDAFTYDSFPSLDTDFLEVYLKWSIEDPVSTKETHRNEVIYEGYSGHSGQGNRNPFIDHPEYACRIWGDTNSTTKALCKDAY